MKASVIIITKNQKNFLQQTIPILLKQTLNEQYEIIVVDSGSTDGAVEYIKNLPVTLVQIEPSTFNFANAFNMGARSATGDYLVRLSGDAIPIGDSWLKEMINPFSNKTVGGVYGKYIITNREGYGYPDFWGRERFPDVLTTYKATPSFFMGFKFFGIEVGNTKNAEYVFNFAGGCCAIRKGIWEKRPFNEKLLAGEDAEYAWFLHLLGYNIVCNPMAKVIHEHKIIPHQKISLYGIFKLNKWQLVFNCEIAKYWLLKMVEIDIYGKLKSDLTSDE